MDITAVGVDLAKHVFQIHVVDTQGHTVLRRRGSTASHGSTHCFRRWQ